MRIAIGADHAGFVLKEQIKAYLEDDYEIIDVGAAGYKEDDDYPDFARSVAHKIIMEEADCGILICDTGIGMDIAANKVPGIRSALVHNEQEAVRSKEHNHANVLSLGAMFLDISKAISIVEKWLATGFSMAERHNRRIHKIEDIYRQESFVFEEMLEDDGE